MKVFLWKCFLNKLKIAQLHCPMYIATYRQNQPRGSIQWKLTVFFSFFNCHLTFLDPHSNWSYLEYWLGDTWHVTCYGWHMKHVTCDRWHMTHFQIKYTFESHALGKMIMSKSSVTMSLYLFPMVLYTYILRQQNTKLPKKIL